MKRDELRDSKRGGSATSSIGKKGGRGVYHKASPPIRSHGRLDQVVEKGGPKRVPLPEFVTNGP